MYAESGSKIKQKKNKKQKSHVRKKRNIYMYGKQNVQAASNIICYVFI